MLFACFTCSVTNFTRERYICVIQLETLDESRYESPQEFLKVHPSAGLDTLGTRDFLIINPLTAVTAIWQFEGITHAAIYLTLADKYCKRPNTQCAYYIKLFLMD